MEPLFSCLISVPAIDALFPFRQYVACSSLCSTIFSLTVSLIALLNDHCVLFESYHFEYQQPVAILPSVLSMSRLGPAHWRGRGPERHPRRVVSLDSLLMVDPVDSTACQKPDSVDMHENSTATQMISDQNSNEGHGTTQPNEQDDELREGEGSQSGSSSSKTPSSTRKVGHSLLRDWAFEIAALVTAFCCLAAIYIILAKFNDQQQPDWPYARTLNLSILIVLIATILRSMLEAVLSSGEYPLLFEVCMCSSCDFS